MSHSEEERARGEYHFAPHEQPVLPGGPYVPAHHPARRIAFVVLAIIAGIASQLGNSMITVNLQNIAGSLGVTVSDASWLFSVYVAVNASANLLLVRARIQYGIPRVTLTLLAVYGATVLAQLASPGFTTALLVRAASGAAGAALTTITIFSLLQVVAQPVRPLAILVGISIPQFATPIARLIPVSMLEIGKWQGLHLIELSFMTVVTVALLAIPLPPSIRTPAFKPLDFLTFGLVFPGMLLFCGSIGAGRYLWWMDTPWLGWAFVAAITLIVLAVLLEHFRSDPLLLTQWIGSADIRRFAVVALLVRFSLAEQTYGAIGLLTAGGLLNDQLHSLFMVVMCAMLLGVVTAVVTVQPARIPFQVMVAAAVIGVSALLDSNSNNLTRPDQLYLSQALLGFGTCLFIGPAMLYGFAKVLQLGPNYLVSFLVVFSVSQNVGGLLGSSFLGSYQVTRAHAHAQALSEQLIASNPQVAARIAQQGPIGLYASLQREATVLAFNDVFMLVAALAFLVAGYLGARLLYLHFQASGVSDRKAVT